jgi:peptidoglycan endopeptidase LytE
LKLKQKLTILPISGIRYTIKSGDNLAKIAKKFSIDLEKIKKFNDLKDDSLKIGEKIIIPNGKKIAKIIKKVVKKAPVKKTSSKTVKSVKKVKTKTTSSLSRFFKRPSTGRFTSPFGKR